MEDEVGQWIPKGIAKGITGNTDAIQSAMKDATSATTFGANVATAVSSRSVGRISTTAAGTQTQIIDYSKLAEALSNCLDGTTVAVDGRQFGKLVRKGVVNAI